MARRKQQPPSRNSSCPCGSESAYADCCEPLHLDSKTAITAEDVMRARYSAHVLDQVDYLRRSWHPETCPLSLAMSDASERWLGLEILDVERGGALDADGYVEFVARFQVGDQLRTLHERSYFVRLGGRWIYRDGDLRF